MRVRVKICGITRVEDALAAAHAGADAIGLVFADSPRKVTLEAARRIIARLPPMVSAVGVFVDAPVDVVIAAAREAGLSMVQLHGSESPDYIAALSGLRVIKAIRVAEEGDVAKADEYKSAFILLDTASPRAAGGTGESFHWRCARKLAERRPVILAGGLHPGNVAEAIAAANPWAVDVSSGVESAPGIKDAVRITEFVRQVRR